MLVDVGVLLNRSDGLDYAKKFLEEVRIPEPVIDRVLLQEEPPVSTAR